MATIPAARFAPPKPKTATATPLGVNASRSRAQRKKHTTHWSSPVVDHATQTTLQRALEVSKPEDEDEQEADAVASEVMRKEETASEGSDTGDKSASNGEHASNNKSISGVWPSLPQPVTVRREATTQDAEELQREPEEEEKDDAEGETLQRAVDGAAGSDDDEDKQAPLRGLGGGCASCGVQRKEEDEEEPDASTTETAQAQLVVGRADDPQEREADAVAERVMRMEDSELTEPSQTDDTLQRAPTSEEDEDATSAPLQGLGDGCTSCGVQRKEDEDEEREATSDKKTSTPRYSPVVLNKPFSPRIPESTERPRYKPVVLGGQKVPSTISNQIAELRRNGGTPLPRSVRQDFEHRFGHDLSAVRIHTGEGPATVAQQLRAKAFTLGKDVVFGSGRFQPETDSGKRLLAHELTHVVQQSGFAGTVAQRVQRLLGKTTSRDGEEDQSPENEATERTTPSVSAEAAVATATASPTPGIGTQLAPSVTRPAAMTAPYSLASTPGSPLPASVRRRIEPILGLDLEHVRVHSDPTANRAAAEIRAKAFTYRNRIFLGAGQNTSDVSLIAHEAAHVVQQGEGRAQNVLQREPEEDLTVGQKCVVKTPQTGNLLLRVEPVHDTVLDGDRSKPNTVGNIKFGTVALIKEVRQNDWFVIEAETLEYGKRTGFVHKKYLFHYVPEALPTPTFATSSTQISSGSSETEQDQPSRAKAKADAQAIRGALGFLNDYDTITRVLSQSPALVKLIAQVYDAETSLTGKGLWTDLQDYLSSSRLEFYAALLKRAGIASGSIATSYVRNAQRGTNTHWITAKPNVRTAVPGTKITYSVEMGPELYATGSYYTYQWMVVNDPVTGKKAGAPTTVMGPSTARWDATWNFAGTHLVLCRVQFQSKQGGSWSGYETQTPEYIEYQQTVSTEKDVVSRELDKTQPREDPGDQLRMLQAYRDALLTAEKQQGSGKLDRKTKEALERQVAKIGERLASSKGKKRYPIRAVHVAAETATVSQLNVFVARTAASEGQETWALVDLTNPTDRRLTGEYTGTGKDAREALKNAIDSWDSNNRYPKGLLRLKVPSETGADIDTELKTDGASFWDSIADFFNQVGFWAGFAALGSAVLLSVAPDPTVSKIAAVALWTSILAGTAGASISMIQRHAEGMSTPTEDAFDTLTIVGNILGARWALGATVKGLALQGTRMGTAIVIGRFGTDIAQGILLSVEFAKEYERILAEPDPKRRTDQLVALLGKAALSGGLLILSMKGNKADLEAVGAKNIDLRRLGNPKETIDVSPRKDVETLEGPSPNVKGRDAKVGDGASETARSKGGVEAPLAERSKAVVEPVQQPSTGTRGAVGAPGSKHLAATETAELARIRTGEPGKIRPESELSNAHVARAMNAQLQQIQPAAVDAILSAFPVNQQARARLVLARASGFGNMESFNALWATLEPHLAAGKKLLTPGGGSLADNLAYLNSKGTFKATTPGTFSTVQNVKPNTVVIVDDVVLARIKSDPAFAKSLVDEGAVLLQPRGFSEGLNLFNATSPEVIHARVSKLLARATEIETASKGVQAFDQAITTALDESTQAALNAANPALAGQLRVVDPTSLTDVSSAAIAGRLNGNAGFSEADLANVLSQVTPADREMLREMLAQQAEVFSPRRIASEIVVQQHRVLASAAQAGVKPENVYFLIPKGEKSYGMMAMAHRQATHTPVERYINGPTDLATRKLGPNTFVVILDDVAGSGQSLEDVATVATRTGYLGKVIVSPVVSTEMANELFTGAGGITSRNPTISYQPGQVLQALRESPFYKQLSPAKQERLTDLLGALGWPPDNGNGLSMAFPYMAPDNNNDFFGDLLAKYFIVNSNRSASKTYSTWKPPPP